MHPNLLAETATTGYMVAGNRGRISARNRVPASGFPVTHAGPTCADVGRPMAAGLRRARAALHPSGLSKHGQVDHRENRRPPAALRRLQPIMRAAGDVAGIHRKHTGTVRALIIGDAPNVGRPVAARVGGRGPPYARCVTASPIKTQLRGAGTAQRCRRRTEGFRHPGSKRS